MGCVTIDRFLILAASLAAACLLLFSPADAQDEDRPDWYPLVGGSCRLNSDCPLPKAGQPANFCVEGTCQVQICGRITERGYGQAWNSCGLGYACQTITPMTPGRLRSCFGVPAKLGDRCNMDETCQFGGNDYICSSGQCAMPECRVNFDCPLAYQCNKQRCEIDVSADRDRDGVPDAVDNCPNDINTGQDDLDGNGQGNTCDADDDGDGVVDEADNCPFTANSNQARSDDSQSYGDACSPDRDADGVPDTFDNCPTIANAGQDDTDRDGYGDSCDGDLDGDGLLQNIDNCPFLANPEQDDRDRDGIGDACDKDIDNDGYLNTSDNCPFRNNPNQRPDDC